MTATIGVKSIGPAETGMIRRQRRRYGSQTSERNRCTGRSEYGSWTHDVRMYAKIASV